MPDSTTLGGSEADILQIAQACDFTVIPSKTKGWWHTAHISSGQSILGYASKEEAVAALWTYPAFREFLVDVWKRHNAKDHATDGARDENQQSTSK